uniref:solute carrier family 13 member 5-like n=1 Tax=Ciona intestinalis TaxID=7719 RepID=UPI000180B3FA|nr:solute carrier family 13 member 5-like [Ciona intestinalis]|eukprot:XP_002120269.1 solute carrier family 13 member 5-like [Ciona intestinalis]
MGLLRTLNKFRSTIILISTPILLLPLMIFPPTELYTEMACAYTILVMAVYWVTEVVPLAVTALLPLVFYPFLGVLPAGKVSTQYLKDVNVLFLGGLTVAVAVEHWNLHKRIALKVLTFVGAKPRWLLFGFMATTAFLSMWISNVATTAMMIPIAQAVLQELIAEQNEGKELESLSDSGHSTLEDPDNDPKSIVHHPHIVHPSAGVVCPAQPNPLVSEMGNIGAAKEYGARLAQDNMDAQWKANRNNYQHSYASVSTEDEVHIKLGNGSSQKPDSLSLHSKRDSEDSNGPDASTAQLITRDSPDRPLSEEIGARIDRENRNKGMGKALTICVCYAANIGGTATLTGTGPNLIMAGQFKTTYPAAPEVDFGSWAFFSFPGMVLFLITAWFWLQYLFLDINLKEIFPCFFGKTSKSKDEMQAERVIKSQYEALGPMSFAEKSVLTLFITLALLWLTRDPGFIQGWGSLSIFKSKYVTDASVAMLITFILFVFPSKRPNFFCCRSRSDATPMAPVPALLTWNVVQQKMAWNVILLLGGGFAMALGSKESGLSQWIGLQMEPLNAIPPFWANFICCIVICALTQCTSNTATATVFLPILAELAQTLGVNPLYLMLPSTIITSYAFMLPVSTPPNAIAYSYGYLTMMDMIKAGFLMNICGIFFALFSVHVFGGVAFKVFVSHPSWLDAMASVNATMAPNTTVLNAMSATVGNLTL